MFSHLRNLVTGASHKSKGRPRCHLPHSMPMLVSTTGYHPRPRHRKQILNIQVCACLTKLRNCSIGFVPPHVGWTLLKTNHGGNFIWTTSSTSAGFECKFNFLYILCYLFRFHFFFHACAQWGPPFVWHTGSTRLGSTTHWFHACQDGLQRLSPVNVSWWPHDLT